MRDYSTLLYFVNNFNTNESFSSSELENELQNVLTELGAHQRVPSERTIKNILDFACSFEVMETKETGYVEMNLN